MLEFAAAIDCFFILEVVVFITRVLDASACGTSHKQWFQSPIYVVIDLQILGVINILLAGCYERSLVYWIKNIQNLCINMES